jgi:Sensors of blue-light using FAD
VVYQIVYKSSEFNRFTDEQLKDLLKVSRDKNDACQVTGLLLYANGNFIQLLEGAKEDVVATYARIVADQRHRGVTKLLEGPCEKRDFADWSMGFKKVEGSEAEKMPGYSDFLMKGADESAQRSAALKLLEFFKKMTL